MTATIPARERTPFGQFQLNRSAIDVGTDYSKVRERASANEMAEMLREHISVLEVAQAFGIAPSTLRSRLTDSGYSSTGHPLADSVTQQVSPEPHPPPDMSWQQDALCAQIIFGDIFFPEGQGASAREAKKVCGRCDVAAQCLAHALETNEQWGVWGGQSERERRKLRKTTMCPLCERPFTTTSNRDRHLVLRHNPDNPHTCPTCGQTFRYPGALDKHITQGSFYNPRHQGNPKAVAS